MAIFGGGRSTSITALMERVRSRDYRDSDALGELLEEIFIHPDAKPKKLMWMITATHPLVRERSLPAIAQLTGESELSLIIRAMVGIPEKTRHELAKEAVKFAESKVVQAIGPMFHSKDAEQRKIALDIVSAHTKWTNFLGVLKKTLNDPEASLRYQATRILSRGVDHQTVRLVLIELLSADDIEMRRPVIQALASRPQVDLVEPFFARLSHEEPLEQSTMTKALSTLADNPESRLAEYLLPVLADEDPALREIAVTLLAKMPNRTGVLRSYFIHSLGLATWLRFRTTASILTLSDSLVGPLQELLEDEDMDVRVGAMMMIGESDDVSFIPLVRKMFESDLDWWIRSLAVDVLAKHASPELIDLLLTEIEDPELRYSIISALGKIEDRQTLRPLLECLKDPQRGVRIATLEALANKKTPETGEALYQVALHDEERMVRKKAASVLEGFGAVARKYLERLELETAGPQEETDDPLAFAAELTMVNQDLNQN